MGEVVRLRDYREGFTTTAEKTETNIAVEQESENRGRDKKEKRISLEKLYPLEEEISPDFTVAKRLLVEAERYLDEALDAERNGDEIECDDRLQHFHSLIPELFCCRELGDGFGSIIVALHYALKNSMDVKISLDGIRAIKSCVVTLREEPFLSHDNAVVYISNLEDHDFHVEPRNLQYLVDMLDG